MGIAMNVLLLFVIGLVWRGVIFRWGVQRLSPPGNKKQARATLYTMVMVAFGLTVLATVCGILSYIPGMGLFSGLVYSAVFLSIFGIYFGLGLIRAIVLAMIQMLGMWFFTLLFS